MASPTNRQAGRIRLLNRKLTVAQKSLQTANDIEKVAKEVDLLQSEYNLLLKEAVGDERFLELLGPAHKQLGEMHVVFALEGIKCRALFSPKMSAEGGPGGVSFTKDVAPLFIVKCGRCHVTNQRGMFSMATFAGLMKGSEGRNSRSGFSRERNSMVRVPMLNCRPSSKSTLPTFLRSGWN
jgi:hypothetical protein